MLRKIVLSVLLALLLGVPAGAVRVFERTTVANLPTCASVTSGLAYFVTDGASASDCSTGAGTDKNVCVCDGSSWVSLSAGGAAANSFETINASSGTDPVADSSTDTLNMTGGTGITVTGDSATDTITIASTVAGDIESVWSDTTGDVSALTAAAGDTLDAGSADASSPATRSTSLPGTCLEGQLHQDTNSGGSETYVCTATDTWTKLSSTATAVSDDVAPYGQYDPDNPPASCAVCDEWTDDTATQTWAWQNQESSTETLTMDGALLVHPADATGLAVRYLTGPDGSSGDFVITTKVTLQGVTASNLAGIYLLATGTAASPTFLHTCAIVASSVDSARVQHQSWTSYTSAAATLGTFTGGVMTPKAPLAIWLQLRYANATKIPTCWASLDGFVFSSTGNTTPLGAHPTTTMGVVVASFSAAEAGGGLFHWWRARTDSNRNLSGE